MSFSGNWFDIALAATVLIFAVLAFLRGFIKDLASFLNWVLAILLTYFLSPHVVKLFEKTKYSEIVINSAVSSILFIIFLIIISMITSRISTSLSEKIPSSVNQSLGFAFGFAKGYFLCALFFAIVVAFYSSELVYNNEYIKSKSGKRVGPEWLTKAQSYPILEVGANILKPLTNFIMETARNNGFSQDSSHQNKKDKILEKFDEIEKNIDKEEKNSDKIEDQSDKEIEDVTGGKGYNFKDIKKMNRLIESLEK